MPPHPTEVKADIEARYIYGKETLEALAVEYAIPLNTVRNWAYDKPKDLRDGKYSWRELRLKDARRKARASELQAVVKAPETPAPPAETVKLPEPGEVWTDGQIEEFCLQKALIPGPQQRLWMICYINFRSDRREREQAVAGKLPASRPVYQTVYQTRVSDSVTDGNIASKPVIPLVNGDPGETVGQDDSSDRAVD